jgi:hypothetical protein
MRTSLLKIPAHLTSFLKRLDPRPRVESIDETSDLLVGIESSWSNDYAIGLGGWILGRHGPLDEVSVCVGDVCVPVTSRHPRPDLAVPYPELPSTDNSGFWIQVPWTAEHHVTFVAKSGGRTLQRTVKIAGSKPPTPRFVDGSNLFNDFVQRVNDAHLSVLEIGSRVVSPGSVSKRPLFTGAAAYTGFDYYPDSNTDVVGDAHKLSHYFSGLRFDAIFSLSVLEHLAMPWVVAIEISKLLSIGGITLHVSHFSWPLHEAPWDFWRFSDEGLKVLFSPPLGFEVLGSGFFHPLRMHLDALVPGQEAFAMQPGFAGVAILARKVAEIDPDRVRWNVATEEVLAPASAYPTPTP